MQPSDYLVKASAIGYRQRHQRHFWEVYEPIRCEIPLVPMDREGDPTGPGAPPPWSTLPGNGHFRSDITPVVRPLAGKTALTAAGADPVAPVELFTGGGELVARERGAIEVSLEPGVYRIRQVSPTLLLGGATAPLLVQANEHQDVFLPQSQPETTPYLSTLTARVEAARRYEEVDQAFVETFGKQGQPDGLSLTAFLAAAMLAPALDPLLDECGLANLAEIVREAQSATILLVADHRREHTGSGVLTVEGLRAISDRQKVDALSTPVAGLAAAVIFGEPGPLELRIGRPGLPALELSAPILASRSAGENLVLTIHARDGAGDVVLASPLPPEGRPAETHAYELVQRYLLGGRLHAAETALGMVDSDGLGAAVLAARLATALFKEDLLEAAGRLFSDPVLEVDGLVLQGLAHERHAEPELARGHYEAACDAAERLGLPLTPEAVLALASGGARLGIEHPAIVLARTAAQRQAVTAPASAATPDRAAASNELAESAIEQVRAALTSEEQVVARQAR